MDQLQVLHHLPMHRRQLHRILTIYKFKNNLTEFNLELPKINHLHLYNTRRRDDIGYTSVSRRHASWGKQKLLYQACKEYNDLDYNTIDPLNS